MIMFGALSVPILYRAQLLKRNKNLIQAYYLAASGIKYGNHLSGWGIPQNLPQEYEFSITEPKDETITVKLELNGRIFRIKSEATVNGVTKMLVKEEHYTGFNKHYYGFYLINTPYPFKRPTITWKQEEAE